MTPIPEPNAQPSIAQQMQQLQDQLNRLADRMTRVEKKLGMALAESPSPAVAAGYPPKAGATRPAASPPASITPARAPLEPAPQPPSFSPPAPEEVRRREGRTTRTSAGAETSHPGPAAVPARERGRSAPMETGQWEALIGGKWALWVGSAAVFLAVAFFMAYAWHALSDGGRLAVGFLAGSGFLAAGACTRGRAEPWFSEGLTGGGLALQYLSLWAGAQRYGLISLDHAFLLMTAVTILGVSLAVRYDAVSLSALATLGGFLTPVLLQSPARGTAQSLSFLTYITLLNAGILAVSLFKRWPGIIWLSFVATVMLMIGWAGDSYTAALRWATFTFVTLYFLLFLGAACFYSLLRREETKPEDLLLLFADALAYAAAGFALLQGAMGSYPGAFPLALSLFFALVSFAADLLAPRNHAFGSTADGLTLFFLTIAIPIQLHQGWIAIAWSVEAAILLTLGRQLSAPLLQRAGQVVWLLSLIPLLGALLQEEPEPRLLFVNARALPLLVSALTSGWMAVQAGSRNRATVDRQPGDRSGPDELAGLYAAWSVLGGAWLISHETYVGFNWHQIPSRGSWQMGALFAIASLWALYSLAVFAFGWRLRHPGIRLNALVVAALATVLPMGVGLTQPCAGWAPFWNLRWLSFLVVGLALGGLARRLSRERELLEPWEATVRGILPIGISLLALCGMSLELYSSFRWWQIPSRESWNAGASFALGSLWSVFAMALLSLGLERQQANLRKTGYLVGAAGIVLLLDHSLNPAGLDWTPLVNLRFLAFCVATATLARVSRMLGARQSELGGLERELAGGIRLLLPIVVALWGLTQETYDTFRYLRDFFGAPWDRAAQMGISLVWTICGVLLLIGGIARRQQPIRLLGLALLGLTVSKVFLFDLSFLDMPYRTLSLGGLGLALIGISWLYSRSGERTHP